MEHSIRKSIYAIARELLTTLRGPGAPVVFSSVGAEAALPLFPGEDTAALIERAGNLICLGARLVHEARVESSHVLLYFSSGFYCAALRHIIANSEAVPMPTAMADGPGFALCRMLMLARKRGTGCPDDESVRHALWLLFAAEDADGLRLRTRLDEAAKALLLLARTKPLPERMGFLDSLGDVGRASSVILYEGMKKLGLE